MGRRDSHHFKRLQKDHGLVSVLTAIGPGGSAYEEVVLGNECFLIELGLMIFFSFIEGDKRRSGKMV